MTRENPVAPAGRCAATSTTTAATHGGANVDGPGSGVLPHHLGTLTRKTATVTAGAASSFELLATLTPIERRVFKPSEPRCVADSPDRHGPRERYERPDSSRIARPGWLDLGLELHQHRHERHRDQCEQRVN